MWLFFSLLALLAFALTDLLGKKMVDCGDPAEPVKMLISMTVLSFFISLALFAFGIGESGLPPWRILLDHPLIMANVFCGMAYWLLYLFCFRYIGLTWEAALSGVSSIFYFTGLVLTHFFSCRLVSVGEILSPVRLIPVLLVLVFTALLPNTELIAAKLSGTVPENTVKDRRRAAAGILILLLALVFDAGDSLTTTLIFDEGTVGTADFIIAGYFVTILPLILCSLIYRKMSGKIFIPFKDGDRSLILYAGLTIFSSLLYLSASSFDAVRTGVIFIAAPIFPIIGARLFLKEKYSWRQYFCVWMITAASVAFCAADYIL